MTLTLRDRYRGAMLGTLAGDAIGAPVEWKDPAFIRDYFAERGLGLAADFELFDYVEPWKQKRMVKKGHPTDDSELAAALAQSLVEYPGFNPADLYLRLRDFIHGNTPEGRKSILTDVAYGSGGTLRKALEPASYDESVAKFAAGEIPTPPSNGSLMRCISVPLRGHEYVQQLVYYAVAQSLVTHLNPECIAACVAYSLLVDSVLSGMEPAEAWEVTKRTIDNLPAMPPELVPGFDSVRAIELTKPDYETEIKSHEGYVVLSLRVAVWAAAEATDFADGIMKAISVGGDTDTYAAIAGGILGAKFGIQGIPNQWVDVLQGKEIMLGLADQLYDIANPS